MDIFHGAIRHQQSILVVKVFSVDGSEVNCSLYGSAVVRMGSLDDKFQIWFRRPVKFKNSEYFV